MAETDQASTGLADMEPASLERADAAASGERTGAEPEPVEHAGADQPGAEPASLEQALAQAERRADAVLKAAAAATSALKRFRAAAHLGNLRDLRPTMAAAGEAIEALEQEFAGARASWRFDEEAYLASGAYPRELLETARRMGLRLYELDDRFYSYPALVRVLPGERAVLIDRARERRLRPSVLVGLLKEAQSRPARSRPDAFLETLFEAYSILLAARAKEPAKETDRDLVGRGAVVRLLDIYNLLTLLPGQTREYSRQEFARDVYLLDQSDVRSTRKGYVVRFPASTGTKSSSGTMRMVTQSGEERLYYGIAFHAPEAA